MDTEAVRSPFLWVLHYGTDLIAATLTDALMSCPCLRGMGVNPNCPIHGKKALNTLTEKEVLNNFKERESQEDYLMAVLRKAYVAATTGELVSRAYNVQMILEEAIAKQALKDDSDG